MLRNERIYNFNQSLRSKNLTISTLTFHLKLQFSFIYALQNRWPMIHIHVKHGSIAQDASVTWTPFENLNLNISARLAEE